MILYQAQNQKSTGKKSKWNSSKLNQISGMNAFTKNIFWDFFVDEKESEKENGQLCVGKTWNVCCV